MKNPGWLVFSCASAFVLSAAGCGGGGDDGGSLEQNGEDAGEEAGSTPDRKEAPDVVPDPGAPDLASDVVDNPPDLGPVCSCDGKQCGFDNCGNACGTCVQGKTCNAQGLCADPPVQCAKNGFNPVEETADLNTVPGGLTFHYQGISATTLPLDGVVVDIATAAPYNGPVAPGTYEVKYKSLASCGLCLYLIQGWNGNGYSKIFTPIQGTITIEQLATGGGPFKAKLNGVVLKEATVDPNSQAVSHQQGAATWCLDGYEMAADIKVPQPYCLPEGSGIMLGDNIADFKLQNCNGEWLSLHTLCNKVEALWVVAIAGW